MSLGSRLREERLRLGLNQTDLAALANASKGAQINWEKDANSPPASALTAYAERGADVLYILTGRRTGNRPNNASNQIEDQLAEMRRDLLEPGWRKMRGETLAEAEERVVEGHAGSLRAILQYDQAYLTPELRAEVEGLSEIVSDPMRLALFRAADQAQLRERRREVRGYIVGSFNDERYVPGDAVINVMLTQVLEYDVPVNLAVNLVEEVFDDVRSRVV